MGDKWQDQHVGKAALGLQNRLSKMFRLKATNRACAHFFHQATRAGSSRDLGAFQRLPSHTSARKIFQLQVSDHGTSLLKMPLMGSLSFKMQQKQID